LEKIIMNIKSCNEITVKVTTSKEELIKVLKEKKFLSGLKSISKDPLKVRLEKITFPMILPNKTQRADWLCLLRTYCTCSQTSPVPPPQQLGRSFPEIQPPLLGTLL
jgi:hypothetical protein